MGLNPLFPQGWFALGYCCLKTKNQQRALQVTNPLPSVSSVYAKQVTDIDVRTNIRYQCGVSVSVHVGIGDVMDIITHDFFSACKSGEHGLLLLSVLRTATDDQLALLLNVRCVLPSVTTRCCCCRLSRDVHSRSLTTAKHGTTSPPSICSYNTRLRPSRRSARRSNTSGKVGRHGLTMARPPLRRAMSSLPLEPYKRQAVVLLVAVRSFQECLLIWVKVPFWSRWQCTPVCAF